jgi:GT2 family glycosyltransferase
MTDVSIIIINYNTYKLTSACIRSVIAKTKSIAYEIILLDNASSECDPQLFCDEFSEVRLIRNEHNLGFAKANNIGIQESKSEFVLLLNSDTILLDDSISTLYKQMLIRPKVAIASGKLIFPDGRLQGCCQRFPSLKLFFFEISRLQKLFSRKRVGEILLGSFFDYETEIYPDWVWGTFMMIRVDLIRKLPAGKLNEEFFMYCEDIQWCLDFKNLGYQIYYTPLAMVIHLMGGSAADKKMNPQNFDFFLKKNHNRVEAWLLKWIYRVYY